MFIADVLVMPSLADVAGSYTFQLFGVTPSTAELVGVGVVWIIIITGICYIGIGLSARLQHALLAMEFITLAVFAIVALIKVYTGNPVHLTHVSADWFNPLDAGLGLLSGATLLAIFIYWGWATGVSVNEENEDATDGPGRSVLISNFVLIGIYLLVTTAVQAYGGLGNLSTTRPTSSRRSVKAFWAPASTRFSSSPSCLRPRRQPRRRSCRGRAQRFRWDGSGL